MTPLERHLRAAEGYLELGMPLAAAEELDAVDPARRTRAECLGLRVQVCQALERWDEMAAAAAPLCRQQPDDPRWPMLLAYATRRADSLARAWDILAEAVGRFPAEAVLHYNLACYEAQLGRLERARERLAEAVRLEPAYRAIGAADPDLEPLRGEG